ncbi:MAG: N-6 DNA methylase [Nitrosomonas sp.]|uniref:N-6 DNA methylase n=1 Tax=Nitrosomonas sp. TaxID=42353 RepID=UPI002735F0D4|nr:N-6 DNA methylase [Nitrosomonas sp.]MDP3281970.1 N-6 DNA methylase [Nitrosomonas sp.]
MLDSDTKRRIDSCRNFLVGKVPDPKSQVEQITIALIYKFMDDMDAEAEELGGKRSFFIGEFEQYGWSRLMAPGIGGFDMLSLYSEAIQKMNENPGVPALFRDIFKNAYLPYRDPETLRGFLKEINGFTYDHSERLGDAFEYLLSVLGSQGDAGQFRTPRHIIDFMVEIVDPKKNESILDPACGTAGFLISSYKHILKHNTTGYKEQSDREAYDEKGVPLEALTLDNPLRYKGDLLTPDDKKRLATNIHGYDISPDMVRLSLVNMYLHGFASPHIDEYDTLTSDEKWNELADVILANPPFMSPKGGIKPHKLFSVQSKRSEVLFVDYVMEHLTSIGRAAIVVPEGINFVEHSAHMELRRQLVENGYLLADITLPHGVFKPYASVKTHILIIDRKVARFANDILFIEIENDGYSQTDTRVSVNGSQLNSAVRCYRSFVGAVIEDQVWKNEINEVRAYTVSRVMIENDKNFNLLGRWYDLPNRVTHQPSLPLKRLGDLCKIQDGLSPNMATQPGDWPLVVPARDRKTADHWDFEGKAVCIPLVSSSGHGKADIKRIHYQEGKFALASTMCALFVKDESVINPRFLHIYLSAMCDELLVPLMCGATNVTMNSSQLHDVLVPVPNSNKQTEIVESYLVEMNLTVALSAVESLRTSITDKESISWVEKIIHEIMEFKEKKKNKENISVFIPTSRKPESE